MLNLDLLRTTYRNGKFFCRFADTGKEENLLPAGSLLTLFREGKGRCRSELVMLARPLISQAPDPKLAAGLEKLIHDTALFDAPDPEKDYPAMRRELFAASGAALSRPGDFSEEHYRTLFTSPPGDIYGDLPDFEILREFRDMTPEALLQRYNVALVQTSLLYARQLELFLTAPAMNEIRKIVKFMKFCRLLATVEESAPHTLHLTLSGPGALLENARKYGLLLSSFFPAVPLLKKYKLRAEIEIRSRKGILELDESSGLVSHYKNIAAYIPEEIRLFHRLFKEKEKSWEIVGDMPFINMGSDGICCPDLSFRNEAGTLCHLELFHRWHKSGLARRMAFLENDPAQPLILGIDRGAAGDELWSELTAAYPRAAARCFRFRDFPGIENVVKTLNRYTENQKENKKNVRKKHKTS